MAKKPATVLQEDGTIAVSVEDTDTIVVEVEGEEASDADDKIVEAAEEPTPRPIKPKKTSPDVQGVVTQPVAEDPRYKEAQARLEVAENARKAAEATANAERQRAEAADRERQRLLKDQEDLEQRASASELALVENAIGAAQRDLEATQEAYTRAAEAGEFAKMAQIQVKMSRAAASLDRYEAQKTAIEAAGPKTHEGRVTAPASETMWQSPTDSTEAVLRQYSPAAQSWLRQHMECLPANYGGDYTKNATMMAGHYDALRKGQKPDSPEYFATIEEHLGLRTPAIPQPAALPQEPQAQVTSKAAETTPAAPRAAPVPSAPVSRDSPGPGGQPAPRNAREVRLTKDQQEMARVSYPHLPEAQAYGLYARSLLELEAEGKMGRLTH